MTAPAQSVGPGRIVRYRLTAEQADQTNARRQDALRNIDAMRSARPGFQVHVGNTCSEGDVCPLIVVRVWPGDSVNGQAFLDGNDALWVTSVKQGDGPGFWHWPPRT